VLKKEYKFKPSNTTANEEPDADGITQSMLDFSWERDVTAQVYRYLDAVLVFLIRMAGHQNKLEGRLEEPDKTVPSQG
jgi:hypothetical protein